MTDYSAYWDSHAQKVGHRTAVTELSEEEYRALYVDLFAQIAPGKVTRMLDYGCGPALLLPIVRELWPEAFYYGADISDEMIQFCFKKYSPPQASFYHVPLQRHHEGRYDFLTCHSVFTHIELPDAVALLKELHRLLMPGGSASISIHDMPLGDNNFGGSIERVDYNRRFFKGMLVQAGFSIEKVYEHSVNSGQTYLGVRKV